MLSIQMSFFVFNTVMLLSLFVMFHMESLYFVFYWAVTSKQYFRALWDPKKHKYSKPSFPLPSRNVAQDIITPERSC